MLNYTVLGLTTETFTKYEIVPEDFLITIERFAMFKLVDENM